MKRRTYINATLAAIAGTKMASAQTAPFRPAVVKFPGYIDVKLVENTLTGRNYSTLLFDSM